MTLLLTEVCPGSDRCTVQIAELGENSFSLHGTPEQDFWTGGGQFDDRRGEESQTVEQRDTVDENIFRKNDKQISLQTAVKGWRPWFQL